MFKIMVVEDDMTISKLVRRNLEKWGYEVYIIEDFSKVVEEFTKFNPNLILMDVNLPFFNGFYWCEKIREISQVPIIFLSSNQEKMDMIMAMNMGADDYITKPFDMDLLITKIQTLLRRTYSFKETMDILQFKEIILDLRNSRLLFKDEIIDLSKNEFIILKVFFENINKYVSKDDLIRELWDSDSFIDDNTLAVNISRLRNKLRDYGMDDIISNKKGIGYGIIED